jgi:hypothetical protein
MKIVFECGGPNSFKGAKTAKLTTLEQSQARGARFKVTYGLQVKSGLTYSDACSELGAAILHDACCEGKATNEGD